MSDAPPPEFRAARHAGAARRRVARGRGAAHGDGAGHAAGPAAARRTGEDAQPPRLYRVRLRPAVPRGDRQAGRRDHPAAARAAPARKADPGAVRRTEDAGGDVARAARDDHRPQRPDPGDLVAHRRGVRRSSPDHRSGRGGASAEAGAAAARRGRRRGRGWPTPTGSSSISNVRSRRASSSPSIRSASRGSISARPSSGTIRWAAPPRRCSAAPMSTSTASPASRSTSTSACSTTARRCGCRSTCASRRWCATNSARRSTSSRRSAAAAS